ncbi:dihydrolipoyl dehydrogenase family protein [Planctomycetota bacterium]
MKDYDVIVIGSGGGMKVALPAAAMGLKTALLERESVAGTCLNRGCIPSKMLIYPTELPGLIRAAQRVNVFSATTPTLDFPALIERISLTVDGMSAAQRTALEQTPHLDFYPQHGEFVGERVVCIGQEELRGDKVFIATGSRPMIPAIPGLADTPFMTSREALRRTNLPERLLVIGAGYIAVELGGAYAAAGSDVAFIVRSRFLRHEDTDVAEEFSRVFEQRHTVHQGCTPVHIAFQNGSFAVTCRDSSEKSIVLEGDALLVATGVTPCTDDLGLDKTKVKIDAWGHIQVDGTLRTHCPGVYALGDCIGHYLYRHTVNYEGEYLVRTVLKGESRTPLDYGPVPHAVFSHPEIAGVGLTESQAQEQGHEVVVGRACYTDSNAGLARGYDHGFVKLLIDRPTRRILGAHILGAEASNLIHLFIAVMKTGGTLDHLLDMIFIHPALPEVARDAARDVQRQCRR